ncbi:MAG TPA: beta-galactosidase [Tepidiformaceae bacterium]|nr:beta-galactosidase [Tepidiformaceae bacterium]
MTLAPDPHPSVPPVRPRVRRAFAILGGGALLALAAVIGMGWVMIALSWPHTEPLGDPAFGINYSCNHAEFLLLEDPGGPHIPDERPGRAAWCAETLGRLHDELGFEYARISVEWAEVEPIEGQFDFRALDAMLAEAERRGFSVLLTVGMKAQRHPEYYLPGWLLARVDLPAHAVVSDDPIVREAALRMARALLEHTAASPAIDAWGAENEPYVPSKRANRWVLEQAYIKDLVALIRTLDPGGRPVVINQGQHFVFDRFEKRWRQAIEDADVLAVSLYPFRNFEVLGIPMVVPIVELGPFAPNYAYQAREARAAGDEYWITEMQAEPWTDHDARLLSPENPSANLDAARFRKNIEYARRTGASRVYLWGAEWWLMQAERYGDPTWLALAREAIAP